MKQNPKEQTKTEQTFYIIGASLGGFALILCILHQMFPLHLEHFLMPCVFHKVTGLYCPGCGGTRAAAAFFRGKWQLSFLYHPIVPYTAAIYLWYMASHSIQRISRGKIKIAMHYRGAYLWIALVLVVVNFVIKNAAILLFHQDILEALKGFW
ncbi:MAG: DUF2752 domain-containing protein [Roseburia sp.]|nr:DUF2752 domain-containing protein [Roseburia sp.]